MVLEREIPAFFEWLPSASMKFVITVLVLIVGGCFVGFLLSALRNGPARALAMTSAAIGTGIREFFEISPRRVWAMSSLAFREAIRRRVLVVFAVFMAMMLFAGWFLDPGADHPAVLYISFVLSSTNFLVLMLAIFLSTFSLPNDVKTKTIYTVVTKPVRAWEIVLGRIIGFSAIGTILLLGMGVFSYFFVVRGLSHTHEIDEQSITSDTFEIRGEDVEVSEGQTTRSARHRHDLVITPEGVRVESNHDHFHLATTDEDGNVSFGDGQGALQARVPMYGKLSFWDRDGKVKDKGINVGNEWTYRSYIEGGTLATAIWTFEGLNQRDFKDPDVGIPLEMLIRVFRTYKGDIEKGIFGSLQVVEPAELDAEGNPKPIQQRNRYERINFTAREFTTDRQSIPLSSPGIRANGEEADLLLFEDIVRDGKLEVWVRCGERAQYFGMARRDVYIRAADGSFWGNFIKGFLGIWFQMVIATAISVMFSTFLTGAVSMVATLSTIFIGVFAKKFVTDLVSGQLEGGGPIEATVRLFTQKNLIIDLEPGITTSVIKSLDFVIKIGLSAASALIPDFREFGTASFVAHGFDIPNHLVFEHVLYLLAFVAALTTAGYFLLRTREIAA